MDKDRPISDQIMILLQGLENNPESYNKMSGLEFRKFILSKLFNLALQVERLEK